MGKFLPSCLELATGPRGELADLISPLPSCKSQLALQTPACLPRFWTQPAAQQRCPNAETVARLNGVPWLRGHQDHFSTCHVPAVPVS